MPKGLTLKDWDNISQWFQASLIAISDLSPEVASSVKLGWLDTAEKVQAEKYRLLKLQESKATSAPEEDESE